MKNVAFHGSLKLTLIILPILTASLIHFSLKGWENVLFERLSKRVELRLLLNAALFHVAYHLLLLVSFCDGQAIEDDLDKHKKDLDDAKATVQEIVEACEDPVLESQLNTQLEEAAVPLDELGDKLNERKGKLQDVLAQSGEFETDLDAFQRWLTKMEEVVAEQRPVSADTGTVKNQKDAYEVCRSFRSL